MSRLSHSFCIPPWERNTTMSCLSHAFWSLHTLNANRKIFLYGVLTPLKALHSWTALFCFCLRVCVPGMLSGYAVGALRRLVVHYYTCLPLVSHLSRICPSLSPSTLWMLRPHESIDVPDGCVNIGIDVAGESEPGKKTRSKTRSNRDANEIRALAGKNSRKVQSEASIEVQRHSRNGAKTRCFATLLPFRASALCVF